MDEHRAGTSLQLPLSIKWVINECDPSGHEKKPPLQYVCICPVGSDSRHLHDLNSAFADVPPFLFFLLGIPYALSHNYLYFLLNTEFGSFTPKHGVCSQSSLNLILIKFIKSCLNFSILRRIPDGRTSAQPEHAESVILPSRRQSWPIPCRRRSRE